MQHGRVSKYLALLLSLILALGILPATVSASDYAEHWAKASIDRAVQMGWLSKSETDTYRPNAPISRAEFVTMVNKMEGYNTKTDISGFSDVKPGDWYYDQFAIAVGSGYISGSNGKLNPTQFITRNETVTILARILGFNLETDNSAALNCVKDASSIPTWARENVSAAISQGLIAGSDGNFNGSSNITRAETAVLLERIYDDVRVFGFSGEYSIEKANSVIIAAPGVTLKGAAIAKDLIVAATVGDGDVYLDGVTVGGRLDVQGGGKNSVHLKNSKIEEVIITKDEVRVVFSDGTTATYVNDSSTGGVIEIGGGSRIDKITVAPDAEGTNIKIDSGAQVESVVVEGGGASVSMQNGASVGDMTVSGANASVDMANGSSISTLNVTTDAADASVAMADGSNIGTANIEATATVTGGGSIEKAVVSAENVSIEKAPATTTVSSGITANVGGKEATGTTTAPPPATSGSSNSGSSNSGSSNSGSSNSGSTTTSSVSSVTVSPAAVAATIGTAIVNRQLTATVGVTGSASKTVTWSVYSAGTTGAGKVTVSSAGLLSVAADAAAGTAVIRATSTYDTTKYGICTVTVSAPAGPAISGIAVTNQPSKLTYTEGENLALSGLSVTVSYDDASTKVVAFADFAANGLSAAPSDGTALSVAAHNGKPVAVTHTASGKTASTSNLTVVASGTPLIATVTTIANEASGASVAVTSNMIFDTNLDKNTFTVNVGATGLTFASASATTNTATLLFTGTAAKGDITIQAKDTAFDSASSASNTITISVPAAALTGTATIDKTSPKIGDILTASLTSDNNTGTLSYVWKAGGTQVGTNSATYTVLVADLGKAITVEISSSVETGTRTSDATGAVVKKDFAGAVTAPSVSSKTSSSVTLATVAGYKYAYVAQNAAAPTTFHTNPEFTGLSPATTYDFYQIAAETDDTKASAVSTKLAVTTDSVVINIATIAGVTAPVAGETPVTAITETAQYTGTVSWSPNDSTFDYNKVYTATITLTPKTGYTLAGVAANFFTVAGTSPAATNSAGSGVITAAFPATEADPGGGTETQGDVTVTFAPDSAETEILFVSISSGRGQFVTEAGIDKFAVEGATISVATNPMHNFTPPTTPESLVLLYMTAKLPQETKTLTIDKSAFKPENIVKAEDMEVIPMKKLKTPSVALASSSEAAGGLTATITDNENPGGTVDKYSVSLYTKSGDDYTFVKSYSATTEQKSCEIPLEEGVIVANTTYHANVYALAANQVPTKTWNSSRSDYSEAVASVASGGGDPATQEDVTVSFTPASADRDVVHITIKDGGKFVTMVDESKFLVNNAAIHSASATMAEDSEIALYMTAALSQSQQTLVIDESAFTSDKIVTDSDLTIKTLTKLETPSVTLAPSTEPVGGLTVTVTDSVNTANDVYRYTVLLFTKNEETYLRAGGVYFVDITSKTLQVPLSTGVIEAGTTYYATVSATAANQQILWNSLESAYSTGAIASTAPTAP